MLDLDNLRHRAIIQRIYGNMGGSGPVSDEYLKDHDGNYILDHNGNKIPI